MKRLNNELVPPPCTWRLEDGSEQMVKGWSYLVEPTQTVIRGRSWLELTRLVVAHMRANGVPEGPDLEAEIMHAICTHSVAPCEETGEPVRISAFRLVKRFLGCVVEAVKRGRNPFVDQEEADRRSTVCMICPQNVSVTCWGCGSLEEFVKMAVGRRRVARNAHLKSCRLCGCSNAAQIWLEKEILDQCSKGIDYPAEVTPGGVPCWKWKDQP